MTRFVYTGSKTNQISFPLGGIGTGCIGLAGNGRLIDWEIFNRPNKGSVNGFSHFAIKAEADSKRSGEGKVLDARVLHADLHPPYSGELGMPKWESFGWGPRREYLTGMPHFRGVVFRGEFPLAELGFEDDEFPGQVRMRAFNPFIPLNDKDSGIPAAFFEIEVENTSQETIAYTIAGTLANPLPANNLNTVTQAGDIHLLHLVSDALDPSDVNYGDLTLATDTAQVSWQQYWFRGAWFDSLEVYWRDFTARGRFRDRTYDPAQAGDGNHGTLAAHVTLAPEQMGRVHFVISWSLPNCENYWKETARQCAKETGVSPTWRNYYATQWEDSQASALYALEHWDRLHEETRLFKEALFASDLPEVALEAVSANLSVLKSPTVMRLEDGTFYGFEGCHPAEGCCEGSCTHVWNYAQALPFLFPNLERSMRGADYAYNLRPDGGMPFRLQLPLGMEPWDFRPCADGQFGGVMKAYRDWKICGDTEWLRVLWPAIKKSIEFAWSEANEDRWDPDRRGVLTGRQHHTLDMELFGPNSWLTGFYLGALKAGAEMAEHLGEAETAVEYRALFERGKAWADTHLFNGEYYHQIIDLKDRSILEPFESGKASMRGKAVEAYWNEEHGEIKYQIGEGCDIDQVLAQWHANLYGLGEIFDPEQTRTALASIFKYNFHQPMRNYYNPCRVYCLNDEGGLVIAHWPEGKTKPTIPLPYSQETQNGYEYAAAIQMIQSGLAEEGMRAIAAIRDRYDGERRNPWNEFECGSNYARSMASYGLLNAFSGFRFDMVRRVIGFDPIHSQDGRFRCFWSLDSGWGEFEMWASQAEVRVLHGELPLRVLGLPWVAEKKVQLIRLDDERVPFTQDGGEVRFTGTIHLQRGQTLQVLLEMNWCENRSSK